MAYNMTALGKITSVGDLFTYANNATELNGVSGILFGTMMIAFFFIMLLVLKRWEIDKALLSSSFACFILSLILSFAQLLNFIYPLVFLIIMSLTAFWMFKQGD